MCAGSLQAIDLPDVIDKKNCSQYKDLLIPAMYRAVERGDYIVTPGKINFKYKLDDKFIAAGAKNKGKYDLNKNGNLIDISSGKYPENIYGFPFPDVDIKDSRAGAKLMFNFDFQRYRFTGSREQIYIMWINTNGEERYISGLDQRLYMNGRMPGQSISNPEKILVYEFQNVLKPMSMKGTNKMAYIYMDEGEDANFAYVPAIRRVRKTSSSARSDPFMGSDSWSDTNYMWNGKSTTMEWKYIGEKTILVSFTSPNMLPIQDMPDGRITRVYPYTGLHLKFGFEDPNWKGAAWAPLNITYVPRKVWIIEQMPRDPYYNWGKHINYIDQETYTIWYKEVYQRSGEFRTWISFLTHYSEAPSGKNSTGDFDCQLFIDETAHHATSVNRSANPEEAFLYMPEARLKPSFFSMNNFLLLSK